MESFKWWHVFRDLYDKMTYFFAKRWLDENFGKREYWGEYISDMMINRCVDCDGIVVTEKPQCQDCRLELSN